MARNRRPVPVEPNNSLPMANSDHVNHQTTQCPIHANYTSHPGWEGFPAPARRCASTRSRPAARGGRTPGVWIPAPAASGTWWPATPRVVMITVKTRFLANWFGSEAAKGLANFQHDGDHRRRGHGRDFRPGVDAPPVPAQQVHRSRARADVDHHVPTARHRVHDVGNRRAHDHQPHGRDFGSGHVVLVRSHGAPRSGDRNRSPGRTTPS